MNSLKKFFKKEVEVILNLEKHLSEPAYELAINTIIKCSGKVVVTGVGKSGHIASKIAATLASTGTPSFFVHPSEACHGDLGMIESNDLIIAISHSGESSEIMTFLPICKRRGIIVIAITSNLSSSISKISDIPLCTYVTEEAGSLNLAPTSSTTATLVLGDAIALSLAERRNFSKYDFAITHPGGALGRKLLLLNEDVMRTGKYIPIVKSNQSVTEAILEISKKNLGFVIVINPEDNKLIGVFTDGDLRRVLSSNIDLNNTDINLVVHSNCITVKRKEKAFDSLKLMQLNSITALVVVSDCNDVVGAFNIHDLFLAGIR